MKKRFNLKINRKGFTLIELIAIVVIITLIASISSYSIIKIINNTKEKEIVLSENNIKKTSTTYVQENKDVVWSVNTETNEKISCVSIQELINEVSFSMQNEQKSKINFLTTLPHGKVFLLH